jgi:hypothetical protein
MVRVLVATLILGGCDMTKQEWMDAFAAHMAQCLKEDVCQWHYDVAEYYVDDMDIYTPEEAVKEEFYCWGE